VARSLICGQKVGNSLGKSGEATLAGEGKKGAACQQQENWVGKPVEGITDPLNKSTRTVQNVEVFTPRSLKTGIWWGDEGFGRKKKGWGSTHHQKVTKNGGKMWACTSLEPG